MKQRKNAYNINEDWKNLKINGATILTCNGKKRGKITWNLQCECGKIFVREQRTLDLNKKNQCKSCSQKINHINNSNIKLKNTRIVKSEVDKSYGTRYKLSCICGSEIWAVKNKICDYDKLCNNCQKMINIDISNQEFNGIKIISLHHIHGIQIKPGCPVKSQYDRFWNCICRCGKSFIANEYHIKNNKTFACNTCRVRFVNKDKNLEGQKINKLYIVKQIRVGRYLKYGCVCDCGNICCKHASAILNGNTTSCGCYQKSIMYARVGANNPLWKKVRPIVNKRNRTNDAVTLAKTVYKRDNYRCRVCGTKGKINCHHINGFHWCIEQRFNPDNCITLCSDDRCSYGKPYCHNKFHDKYGRKNNTLSQFLEFLLDNQAYDTYNSVIFTCVWSKINQIWEIPVCHVLLPQR